MDGPGGLLGPAVAVPLLLALIWAAVLVPPAMAAHARRRADFLVSCDRACTPHRPLAVVTPARGPVLTSARRRRQILAGLLVAMAATLMAGLLPPLRVLLVVHLFLLDSFLAYVTMLVHLRRQQVPRPAVIPEPVVIRPRRPMAVTGRPPLVPELPPLAAAWRNYT